MKTARSEINTYNNSRNYRQKKEINKAHVNINIMFTYNKPMTKIYKSRESLPFGPPPPKESGFSELVQFDLRIEPPPAT